MNKVRIGKGILLGVQVVFIIIAFIFIEWMQNYASGNVDAAFDLTALTSWWRWVVIAAQTVLAVYIVNLIMTYGYDEKKTRATSRLCIILKTNELRIDKIYAEKRLSDLDNAVERVNENAKNECNLRHMRKLNARITQEDINCLLSENNAEKLTQAVRDFKSIYCVVGVKKKRFDKAVGKLLSGKFTDYETVTADELLIKGTFERSGTYHGIKDRRNEVRSRQLIKKAVWSILSAFALGIIITDLIMEFSIVSAVANGIYIFMALVSGIFSNARYCGYVEGLFDRRNGIFGRELGITDTWQPPKEEDEE